MLSRPGTSAYRFNTTSMLLVLGLAALIVGCGVTNKENAVRSAGEIRSGKSVAVANALVVTADSIASAVGIDVLREGGNAIDAAVATAFALAVTYPRAGNIGGGGFMLVRLGSGETHFVDFRETAPAAATRDMYLDPSGDVIKGRSTQGSLAVGVPGTVAGMALAHSRFGTLPWEDVLTGAWRLAKDGVAVDESFVEKIRMKWEFLSVHPETKRIFVDPQLNPGDTLSQPDLAETLFRLMREGAREFYTGRTAELIADEMERTGGLITMADLAGYEAKLREAVRVRYGDCEIVSAPPPSSGGVILAELFQLLEPRDVGELGYHSRDHVHLLAEAEKIAYRLRAQYMGDEDYYPTPWRELTDASYVDRLDQLIDPSRVLPIGELEAVDLFPIRESEETTHISIIDQWGNAVATTYTLNGSYGSGVMVTEGGFLLNNEMDDFSIKPGYPNLYGLVGSEANAIEPGKRMLSSMSPTMVLRDDEIFMILGTPGGSTIPTTVLQVISNVVDFHMSLETAVAQRRVHNQYLPDRISVEDGALADPVVEALRQLGHRVVEREDIGDVQAILIRHDRRHGQGGDGRLVGVSDPRGKGRAIGY